MQMKVYTRAVITGASSGIGEKFAEILAQEKTNLILVARREDRLKDIAERLVRTYGVQVDVLPLDLSLEQSAEALFSFCTERNYQVDLLINNAGVGTYRNFLKTPLSEHRKVVMVNVLAPVELMHSFAGHMTSHGRASTIINVGSVAGFVGVPRFTTYSASKSFLYKASTILNFELKGSNVNISCLCPGATESEFMEKNNQKRVERPLGSFMSAEDVAREGLKGARRNRPVVIAGMGNRWQVRLARFFPDSWTMQIARRAMEATVQEQISEGGMKQ